jgi:hypothetical protein
MYLVCTECFSVIEQCCPLGDPGVVPVLCTNCRKRKRVAMKRLGIGGKKKRDPSQKTAKILHISAHTSKNKKKKEKYPATA